jgi:hypothetical protein
VGRSPYQSEKRRKELARLKKQEEKRQRRFNKKQAGDNPEGTPVDGETLGPDGMPVQDGQPVQEAGEGLTTDAPAGDPPSPAKDEKGPGQPS